MKNRILFTLLLLVATCLSVMAQQGQTCHNFDNQSTNGWTIYNDSNGSNPGGTVTNGVAGNPIANVAGSSGTAGDFGLHVTDRSGSTWLYNQTDFTGDFTQRVGECLCFDFQLLNDEAGAVVNPSLFFFSGFDPSQPISWGVNPVMAARFTATTSVTANSGWVKVCAPIDLCDSSGNLPSNAEGAWTIINGGTSDCTDWQSILSTVTATVYAVDMSGWGGTEQFDLDNICIENCSDACAEIIDEDIICNPDGTATINFSIKNTSGSTLDEIEILELPSNTNIVHYNYGINLAPNGTYGTISLTVPANTQQYCTRIRFFGEEECCHIDYCVDIPICNPCDSISITSTPLSDPTNPNGETDDCCHSIDVNNQFSGSYFTHITSTIITPGVSFSNPVANSGWNVAGSGNQLDWTPPSTFVPMGTSANVMDFCLDGIIQQSQTPQTVIFDWWATDAAGGEEVVCSDTLYFDCTKCLLVSDESIECLEDGSFQYNFTVWNMTNPAHDATHLRLLPLDPSSGVCLDGAALPLTQLLPGSPVSSGNSANMTVNISDCGAGLTVGSTVGFRLILLDNGVDLDWCCHVDTLYITLPDCPTGDCTCEDLQADINLGVQVTDGPLGTGQCSKTLTANGLEDCDEITWLIDGATYGPFVGNQLFNHVFPSGLLSHTVCIWVVRTTPTGEICEMEYCFEVEGCPNDTDCTCDNLQADISLGIDITNDNGPISNICTKNLSGTGLKECDEVRWIINGTTMLGPVAGDQSVTYTFGSGTYNICMIVTRTTATGEVCEMEYCTSVPGCFIIFELDPVFFKYEIELSPNPTVNTIHIQWKQAPEDQVKSIRIMGMDGKPALATLQPTALNSDRLSINVSDLQSGTYLISIRYENGHRETQKFVKLPPR